MTLEEINSGEPIKNPEALGQVTGAIIGVLGLFLGTFITILTTFFMRKQDLKREDRRERCGKASGIGVRLGEDRNLWERSRGSWHASCLQGPSQL